MFAFLLSTITKKGSKRHSDVCSSVSLQASHLQPTLPPDDKMLVLDPKSLNWAVPMQGENYIRSQIELILPARIKNEQIKPVFDDAAKDEEDKPFSEVITTSPLDSRLCP